MNLIQRLLKGSLPDDQGNEKHSCACSTPKSEKNKDFETQGVEQVFNKKMSRRAALGALTSTTAVGAAAMSTACSPFKDEKKKEVSKLEWEEYFKGSYRVMTDEERSQSVERLIRLHQIKRDQKVNIQTTPPQKDVLFGYAFNISKCQGYMDCVTACIEENNQDRDTKIAYIKIFESKNGSMNLENSKSDYFHEVPAKGHFYMGTQCFHCENPPCVDVCPVKATWKEDDGIVVVDYDWCIGCRYCEAACPYFGRRFNWSEPNVPTEEINKEQHYLGNRMRKKGVMEKCTFCIQRSRKGQSPACVEACPTGARVFGNLLDPDSELRWILANKKVFRLREDLGTDPKFWYYMD